MAANSTLQNLYEIFNNKFFRIPDYQRGYAWGESQLKDFWDDIYYLESSKYHYTGLITIKSITQDEVLSIEQWKDDLWLFEKGFKAYYVIDGQQRLLTVMILLKVILDKFNENEEINFTSKAVWFDKFFFQKSEKHSSFIMGYEKDNPSNEYYEIKILDKPTSPIPVITETLYTANLKKAKKFLEDKILTLSKEELQTIIKKIVTNLKFNLYEIDDELDVCVTFETMNNRGKPLSKLEILKNRLIYLSTLLNETNEDKRQLRDKINSVWKTIYEYLGKNIENPLDDDEFLDNHWRIFFKYTKEEGKAYSKFLLEKYFISTNILAPSNNDSEITYEKIDVYIQSLSKCVVSWYYIFNPKKSIYNDEIVEWLLKLLRINNNSMAPIVMAALAKDENNENVFKLLKAIEKYNFLIFRVTDRRSTTGNSFFYGHGHDYYHDNISIRELIRLIIDFIDNHAYGFDIKAFNTTMENMFDPKKNLFGFYSWSGIRYFLFEYELWLQNECRGSTKVNWEFASKLESIEHIYPQKPKANTWCRDFTYHLSNENKFRITHSLGNLVLVSFSKNIELSNESFENKKKYKNKQGVDAGYFNGSYSEIEISQNNDWTPLSIYERGKKLLDFMEKRWDIEIPDKDNLLNLQFLI